MGANAVQCCGNGHFFNLRSLHNPHIALLSALVKWYFKEKRKAAIAAPWDPSAVETKEFSLGAIFRLTNRGKKPINSHASMNHRKKAARMRKPNRAIGYVPLDTRDGTTYYATENGGASTLCRRMAVTLVNPFLPAPRAVN